MAAAAASATPRHSLGTPQVPGSLPQTLTSTKTNRLWLQHHGFLLKDNEWRCQVAKNTIPAAQEKRCKLALAAPNAVRISYVPISTSTSYDIKATIEKEELDLPCVWPKTASGKMYSSSQF